MADRKYMDTLKQSGIDFERLRQSSLGDTRTAGSIADNVSDFTHDNEPVKLSDVSTARSSHGERSPDRDSIGHESLCHQSREEASGSPSLPEYTQEYDDDYEGGSSVVEEELETELA